MVPRCTLNWSASFGSLIQTGVYWSTLLSIIYFVGDHAVSDENTGSFPRVSSYFVGDHAVVNELYLFFCLPTLVCHSYALKQL